jgi:hypothetical protein
MNPTQNTNEYLLLFRGSDWYSHLSPAELQSSMAQFMAWFDQLKAEGILKTGQPLLGEGRIISARGGAIVDGPFAESKETVGGYFIITAPSLESAAEIARQSPGIMHGAVVEVRPIAAQCPTFQRAAEVEAARSKRADSVEPIAALPMAL